MDDRACGRSSRSRPALKESAIIRAFRHPRPAVLAALTVAALVLVPSSFAALTAPTLAGPTSGQSADSLPIFSWNPVNGAASYEFRLRTAGGSIEAKFATKNTRATWTKTVVNGEYVWDVRSVNATGGTSAWSAPRTFVKNWDAQPALVAPENGAEVQHPAAVVLRWDAVPRAADYLVKIGTSQSGGDVSELITEDDAKTEATSWAVGSRLSSGETYYWQVVPRDAQEIEGRKSPVRTFTWEWDSTTTLGVDDLVSEEHGYAADESWQVFDPQFSWTPVKGAAKYEVEINPSWAANGAWPANSKVCCAQTTIATTYSPKTVLKDNNGYYVRVRAIDLDGNNGVWNELTDGAGDPVTFAQAFDKPAAGVPAVANVRMRDNVTDPGVDVDPVTAGYQTEVPVVTWDPVPGASRYDVQLTPRVDGVCDYGGSFSRYSTATTAWTPLGPWAGGDPLGRGLIYESGALDLQVGGSYCVRVRAQRDRYNDSEDVVGAWSYLGGTSQSLGFTFTGYPTGAACTPSASCDAGFLGYDPAGDDDYVEPQIGAEVGTTPLFTWKPIAGMQSYYVVVASDPNFASIVDQAITRVPAYAPRKSSPFSTTTYRDEDTSYFWAVLPATAANGGGVLNSELAEAAPHRFDKHAPAPAPVLPVDGSQETGPPTFTWKLAEGARKYRLQVATDPQFSQDAVLETVTTASTSYTASAESYPAEKELYWRVMSVDENLKELTPCEPRTFSLKRPKPVVTSAETVSDQIPVWRWEDVPGAVAYNVDLVPPPGGSAVDASTWRSTAISMVESQGTGLLKWRVQAVFPSNSGILVEGPWSDLHEFTQTMGAPPSPETVSAEPGNIAFRWQPKLHVEQYRIELATREDFAVGSVFHAATTDNTSYAPAITFEQEYVNGGIFYWRVTALDRGGNPGASSTPIKWSLPRKMTGYLIGSAMRNRTMPITVHVGNTAGGNVGGASVKVTGAGVNLGPKATTANGNVTFKVRPTRKGTISYTVTKSGWQKLVLTQAVTG